MLHRVRAGTVWVNNYRVLGHTVPFGGYGQSGIGREQGASALDAYSETKSVWFDTGNEVRFGTGLFGKG
jgi:aldehyde dehydrogenase (NAD+)